MRNSAHPPTLQQENYLYVRDTAVSGDGRFQIYRSPPLPDEDQLIVGRAVALADVAPSASTLSVSPTVLATP